MVLVLKPALPAQSFLPSTKKGRDYIHFVEKKGAKDRAKGAELPAHTQEYRTNTLVHYALQARVGVHAEFTEQEVLLHSPGNERALLESIGTGQGFETSEWIETHVERRVQLFFLQLIACYKTPFIYSATRAEDEIGGGCTVKMHNPAVAKRVTHKTQAAHSSTLPCLYAQPEGEGGSRFVYLKHSHLYNQHNATVELPIYVNQADTYIDETLGLREKALRIINKAARAEVSPQKGIQEFMAAFTQVLEEAVESLEEGHPKRIALEMYLERAADLEVDIEEDPGIFDHLLGVQVEDDDASAVLRDVVFAERFKLIQKTQTKETEIARLILDAQNKMLKKKHKSLKKVDYRLKYVLLETAPAAYRKRLEKLLCTSLDQLQSHFEKADERLRECERRAAEKKVRIASFRAKHKEAIKQLERGLRPLFRGMSSEELLYRSKVFRGLRVQVRNWTQQSFSDKYRRAYPADSMSRSMVSRFEGFGRPVDPTRLYETPEGQRKKVINIARALKIAATFEVDAGIFLPSLVSSSY